MQALGAVVPWLDLEQVIGQSYPTTGRCGRPLVGLRRMLRMYFGGVSDEGIEDAIYDRQSNRSYVSIDLSRESAPDVTTLLKFRHRPEGHQLT